MSTIVALTAMSWYDPPDYPVKLLHSCGRETIERLETTGYTVIEDRNPDTSDPDLWGRHNVMIQDQDLNTYLATLEGIRTGDLIKAPPIGPHAIALTNFQQLHLIFNQLIDHCSTVLDDQEIRTLQDTLIAMRGIHLRLLMEK